MQYRGLTLDPFQERAIAHLQDERSVLVAAPTGTGKTIIADWIVEVALQAGKQVIYTAPIKALSNQKYRDYCRLHGEQNVGLVTGDLVIRRDAPCLVMTTEILRNMLLGGEKLTNLHAVVVDEIHFLDDRERGTVWEEMLIYLPQHVLIVALSATLPNLDEFSAWLSHVRERPVEVIIEEVRAVPLDYYFAVAGHDLMTLSQFAHKAKQHMSAPRSDDADGGGRGGRGGRSGKGRGRGREQERGRDRRERRGRHTSRTHPIDVFKMVRHENWLPMLYFVFSRGDAERFARALALRFRAELLSADEVDEVDAFLREADVGPALDPEVAQMYRQGIGFHHAGLHVQLKAIVEELYERKLIKCLFCTSTFALGINMPARTVVFHGLMKFDGEAVRPLSTRGFMQKAGRAGRRGLDESGHVIIRMDFEDYTTFQPVLDSYRRQAYEPVRSSFNLSWNSIVNLLDRHDLDHVRTIVDKSFLSWHLSRKAEAQVAQAEVLEAKDDDARTRRDTKEARRLRQRAERSESQCWDEFLAKRSYLQQVGYLDEDDTFRAGAKVLRHLQIAEILVTELILEGILEDLDEPAMFGLLCALTNSTPRAVTINARVTRKDRELAQKVQVIRMRQAVTGAEQITRQEVTWCPDLIPLGRAWANGVPLDQILFDVASPTDWSGTLITGFRRAKDLAGQLRDVYAEIPDRHEMLSRLIKRVSRDEVEVVD